jgi:hypothetical protein
MKRKKKQIYVYAKLSNIDLSFVRIGGAGLANCMFMAARAYILSKKNHWTLIDPTWFKISIGPYLRKEKDKRHYYKHFKKQGVSGLKKISLLIFTKKYRKQKTGSNGIVIVEGLENYFKDLLPDYELVYQYFTSIINYNKINTDNIEHDKPIIGIHVRLGDYVQSLRTPITWYEGIINQINDKYNGQCFFHLFSDGTDEELKNLLSIVNVCRVFYGNALADILALSKCNLIIGSDSTFSGWGAFLGQVPVIFPKCHFGNVLVNKERQIILNNSDTIPKSFLNTL